MHPAELICVDPPQDEIFVFPRNDKALQEKGDRSRTLPEATPINVGLGDLQGKFLEDNMALAPILGYRREELRSLNFLQSIHPDDLPIHRLFSRGLSDKLDNFQ